MFVITGITGQVGGVLAQTLLDAGLPVRAVVRDAAKGAAWQERGCEVALADMADGAALQAAFTGAQAVFVLIPPNFAPSPDFRETRAIIAALMAALTAARPGRVVCLSTIGAQATQPNLLNQLGLVEQALRDLPVPVTFLRAAWFMENAAWDIEPAWRDGLVPSFLQPLERPVPMVAVADIGKLAAQMMQQQWQGHKVVELEGPRRYAPQDIGAALSAILARPVAMQVVPAASWEALFRLQGSSNPIPRIQMLNGFNEGWIAFEGAQGETLKGTTTLEQALGVLVKKSGRAAG